MALTSVRCMKVLVLEPSPVFGGGSEAVALSLSEELAKLGHKVALLHDSGGSMLERYSKFCSNVERMELPGVSLRAPGRTLRAAVHVARFLRRERVEVAFCSNVGCIETAALISVLAGVKFCFHLGLPCYRGSIRQRLAFRRTGYGVAPSAHTASTWTRAGWGADRLAVVPNWVDANRFHPATDQAALRVKLGISTDARCIVFLGRLCPEKGVGDLLSAFARVCVEVPRATLVLVGGPADHYRGELEARLSLLSPECRAKVSLAGAAQNPEDFLAASDLVCAPSQIEESFGLVVLEAMACGVPVVAARVGIIPEILGTPGKDLLAAPSDSAGLADLLVSWLLRPKQSREIGNALRQRALESFSAAGAVSSYESIMQSLARGRGH